MSAGPRTPTGCPACPASKRPREYLCKGCWFTLPKQTRARLNRRDDLAARRLSILLDKISAGQLLHTIEVPA